MEYQSLNASVYDAEAQQKIVTGFMLADMVAFQEVNLGELFGVKTEEVVEA